MTNTKLLEEKINSSGYRKDYIADRIGITRQSLTKKINNETAFTVEEAQQWCDVLKITRAKEKEAIFFSNKVD